MTRHPILFFCVFICVGFGLGWLVGYGMLPTDRQISHKVVYDTIAYVKPQPISVRITKPNITLPKIAYKSIVERKDSLIYINTQDTTKNLIVAQISKEYKDSTYHAIVSGIKIGEYEPSLDFIETYNRTEIITKIRKPRFAVTLGVGCGYDFAHKNLSPTIGVGCGFVLWSK